MDSQFEIKAMDTKKWEERLENYYKPNNQILMEHRREDNENMYEWLVRLDNDEYNILFRYKMDNGMTIFSWMYPKNQNASFFMKKFTSLSN